MSRMKYRSVSVFALVVIGLVWLTIRLSAQTGAAVHSTASGEWPTYAGDVKGSRYSPLAQIDANNFASWKSPGASRPTISARGRSPGWRAHR